MLQLRREFRRGEKILHDPGIIQLHVAVVATVIGQAELLDRKLANLLDQLQALPQVSVGIVIGEHVFDIDALIHERKVAAGAVPVIAEIGTTA